jgi:hypothetical protein
VIVWLWEASGPTRSGRGITDDETRARQAAEAWIRAGHASAARVEKAHAALGIESLTSEYVRTGHGWVARRRSDGRIAWVPFSASLPEQAAS